MLWGTLEDGHQIGDNFADEGCGRTGSFNSSFDCFFQPLSTCTTETAPANNSLPIVELHCYEPPDATWSCKRGPQYWEERITAYFAAKGTRVSADYLKLWWRAQAVTYMIRLNSETADAIRAMRMDHSIQNVSVAGVLQADSHIPYPLLPGTISMHVRHGDKHVEMQLINFTSYVQAAEKLVAENPIGLKRRAFVSSEDPGVITDALALERIDPGAIYAPH